MLPTSPPATSTPAPPPTFKDAAGRTWTLALSIGKARRIKDATAVDFGAVADGRVFLELGADPFKLCAVLFLLCEAQADLQNVTPEAFAEALDGEAIDAAMEALIAAIVLFTRAPMRGAMERVIATTLAAQAKSMEAVERWTEANAERIAETVTNKATEALEKLGN